ncbi:hypothetical protein CAEBREN_09650 [Caenorhabditis brenneri]|uniref:Uncharacterized protein n=1 Tax=Caenorhabditis brenneri TaxID=135651 RepID=G0PM75_CAEBE|nr:hypothetical protein CAEBREN_09650 [Caenorhabditis brenneri]
MKSADEAKTLLNLTYKAPIRIRDKDVQVPWCRDSMSKLIQQQMSMLTAGPAKNFVAGGLVQGNMTGAEIAAADLSKAHDVRQTSHHVGKIVCFGSLEVFIEIIFQVARMPSPAAATIPPNFSVPGNNHFFLI